MLTRKGEMTNVVTDDDLVENYSNLLMEYALESGHEMIILKKDNICQKSIFYSLFLYIFFIFSS